MMMRVAQQKAFLLDFLAHYPAADETEWKHVQQLTQFLNQEENPFDPQLRAGHVTVSSILLNQTQDSILFHYHEKLARWLQFGGHVEPDQDFNTLQAAIRELMEETGLSVTAFGVVFGDPIDIDVHLIPARGDFPEHPHHDLRYVFKLILPAKFDENSFRWIPLTELMAWEDASVARFSGKVARALAASID